MWLRRRDNFEQSNADRVPHLCSRILDNDLWEGIQVSFYVYNKKSAEEKNVNNENMLLCEVL